MDILFKDDKFFYYIEGNYVTVKGIGECTDIDSSNIPHIDNVEILFYYRNIKTNKLYPVYYTFNDHFITKNKYGYIATLDISEHTRDYTSTNLNLLEGGEDNI